MAERIGVSLGDVLTAYQDGVKVDPSEKYPNLGLYSYGRGPFPKPPIDGKTTSAPKLFRVRAGHFIYSKLFAFEGAFAVVPQAMDGWFVSNEYPTFLVDNDRILTQYLEIVVCRPRVWQELAALTVGMGHRRQRLKPEALLQYQLELPGLDEQRRIVSAVESVDTAIARARDLAQVAREYLNAKREQLLTEDGEWRTDQGWKTAPLNEITEVKLGFTKGRKLNGDTRELPYLRAVNVQDGYIKLDDVAAIEADNADRVKYELAEDDVLLLEGGNADHVGRAWIWDGSVEPCLHQNSTMRARVRDRNEVDPRFVAWALGASPAKAYCYEQATQTSGVAHLGLTNAKEIPLPVPPITEQERIVAELDTARELLVAATRKVERLVAFRGSLVEGLVLQTHRVRAETPEPALAAS